MTMQYEGLGHICIIVDDIERATSFYQESLGAMPVQNFPHFKNNGFAKAAGFLEEPEIVDFTIRFLALPGTKIFLELMEYHSPVGNKEVKFARPNDMSGVRHVCLKVTNIDACFAHLKNVQGITMVHQSPEYKPCQIDSIKPEQLQFFDEALESNRQEKEKVCQTVGKTRFFYFFDQYGIQWELEQGHSDIGE
jgi:methylmalonyl-CoA/ethylmalonyl-CoA epimerase